MNDSTVRRPIKWNSYGDTHVGMVRKVNEDSILSKSDMCLWAVADGMGGYEAGDYASNMIVSTLGETEYDQDLNDMANKLVTSLNSANQRILDYSKHKLNNRTTGSTVVCLVIRDSVGMCLWAGDSRLYRFRNQRLEQISQDHSQVEELIRQGMISREEAKDHPQSNVITRAIGASPNVIIDTHSFSIMPGDTFLLCSDGLYNAVTEDEINYFLKNYNTNECVNGFISRALENGAKDNVSAIVIKGERDMAEIKPDFINEHLLSE